MKIKIEHIIDLEFSDLNDAYEFMKWIPENNIAITYFNIDNRKYDTDLIIIKVTLTDDEDYIAFKLRWT